MTDDGRIGVAVVLLAGLAGLAVRGTLGSRGVARTAAAIRAAAPESGSRGVARSGYRKRWKVPAELQGERPPDSADEHAVTELILFTMNDAELYEQAKAIAKTVAKLLVQGRFERWNAARKFESLAENGARKFGCQYERPRATHWSRQKYPTYFTAKVRREASWELLDRCTEAIEAAANEMAP